MSNIWERLAGNKFNSDTLAKSRIIYEAKQFDFALARGGVISKNVLYYTMKTLKDANRVTI